MIDWARVAEPQADGYDTGVVLELAATTTSPLRDTLYVRRPPGGDPTLFDGAVAVRHAEPPVLAPPTYRPAPLDHPNLGRAAELIRRWPAAYTQIGRLLDTIHPYMDTRIQEHLRDEALGSSSHSEESCFGAVAVTVDDALGLAQALVHEMSHHKLRALGVSLERADRLIKNDPTLLYESPIRKDRKRPMTAVFHAEYSFIHVTALDVHMLEAERDPTTRERLLMLLARNAPRMEAGLDELTRHLETDADGQVFAGAFLAWTAAVLRRGNALLDEGGYGRPAL